MLIRRSSSTLTLYSIQAILVYPDPLFHGRREEVEPWNDRVQIGGEELEFTVRPDETGRLINPARHLLYNCFSLLYSRLFTDIEEDGKYDRRLRQVGVTRRKLRGQALSQMAVIFFLPFVVGLVHSTVAMYALGTLTRRTVLHYGWGAALLFLFLFGAFFFGTGQLYWRSLQDGLQREARSGVF